MTPTERKLNQDMRQLAESGPLEAPAHVERALVAAFRARRRRQVVGRWTGIGGAILGVAAGFMGWSVLRPDPPARPIVRSLPPMAFAVPVPVSSQPSDLARPPKRKHAPRWKLVAQETAQFYELPDADADSPLEYATVVRVQLPLSALRDVGWAVNEQRAADRVQADVLLGQDGLARAVRFVE